MLIDRIYKKNALALLKSYPVLCVVGPRQCGKTTFAKATFEGYEYLDLELPSDHEKIAQDPELFLQSRTKPLILDEAQQFPQVFPIIRSLVDKQKKNGQYILLGSASFSLIRNISESLAGRVGFLDLAPFLLQEVSDTRTKVDALWLKGGFPDAYLKSSQKNLNFNWFENYSRTFIERDLYAMGIEVSPQTFRKLWTMLAHYHGNVLNMNKIASAMGISPHTVNRYLDILEQTFLIRRLPPYFANIKKRLVKSPKLYFRDTGLLHYFLKILNQDDLIVSPHRGESFEGFIIEQLIYTMKQISPEYDIFYFRTSDEIEIDLIFQRGNTLIPIEIKTISSPSQSEAKALIKAKALLNYQKAYIICPGNDRYPITKDIECVGLYYWANQKYKSFLT